MVVAAGAGRRFGGGAPKQLAPLRGRRVLDWSMESLRAVGLLGRAVVVLPAGGLPGWSVPTAVRTVPGGEARRDSVMSGLEALPGCTHALVHDAARPLAGPRLFRRVMEAAERSGGAVPVLPVPDTVKRLHPDGTVEATLDRSLLGLSQTPQGFRLDLLIPALEAHPEVTDECQAMELAGHRVETVRGETSAMKLTWPDDLRRLEAVSGGAFTSRVGNGLDFHPFAEGRPLVLGGLRLAEEGGLLGHSDGDVMLHAVADALLSASRSGDIGALFPPGDPRFDGADSALLLGEVAGRVAREGWSLAQLDVTLIGERPRVGAIREELVGSLAELLGVPDERVWVKGTTTNSLGALGRGEGLGCLAMAVLERREARD